jgi:hypothetical protein
LRSGKTAAASRPVAAAAARRAVMDVDGGNPATWLVGEFNWAKDRLESYIVAHGSRAADGEQALPDTPPAEEEWADADVPAVHLAAVREPAACSEAPQRRSVSEQRLRAGGALLSSHARRVFKPGGSSRAALELAPAQRRTPEWFELRVPVRHTQTSLPLRCRWHCACAFARMRPRAQRSRCPSHARSQPRARAQVSIRLQADLSHPLRALASPLVFVARAVGRAAGRGAAATFVAGASPSRAASLSPAATPTPPPRRSRGADVDAAALAAATVDSRAIAASRRAAAAASAAAGSGASTPSQHSSSSGGASASSGVVARREVARRIDDVEQRFALEEMVLNQQKNQQAELMARVARLEARTKEDALERHARLAALERETELEKRLHVVEFLTAASPAAKTPPRGVALLQRAASAPKPSPARLARALSHTSLSGLPEEEQEGGAVGIGGARAMDALDALRSPSFGWPLLSPGGGSDAEMDGEDGTERENTPPPDGTPTTTPARVRTSAAAAAALARSPSADSDAGSCDSGYAGSSFSGYSASQASPAWDTVMRQIPSFSGLGSLPPTPRSTPRRTPGRSRSGVPPASPGLGLGGEEATPPRSASGGRGSSPPCDCRDPASPEGSPTIHAEACSGQACASASASALASALASAHRKPPLRRALSTPPPRTLASPAVTPV